MTGTPLVVAVDGGGSKTDAVALSLDGQVLARQRRGGSSLQLIGVEAAVAVVDDVVTAVLDAVPGGRLTAVHTYLSGIDFPEEAALFRRTAAALPWLPEDAADWTVDNDLFALLRAGTDRPDAVAVVCGTGINALGVRRDGAVVRFPALGEISGDWGGGAYLGEQALWHAARAADGRGPATRLADAVPRAWGLADMGAAIHALHFGTVPRRAVARLSPLVFAVAEEGDAVSGALVDRQAEEIVLLVASALRRLALTREPVPVVLGGGVISGGHERLIDGIVQGLAAQVPNAQPRIVTSPPLVGAALLALEGVGAAPAALAHARRALESSAAPSVAG